MLLLEKENDDRGQEINVSLNYFPNAYNGQHDRLLTAGKGAVTQGKLQRRFFAQQ